MAKRSIDFTKERTERLGKIALFMGINGVYGELPKTIDFCITCTEKYLELLANVTPTIKADETRFFFQAVINQQKTANKAGEPTKTGQEPPKVTP